MRTTTNFGLKVWNLPGDEFNPQDLADNWDAIDADYSRPRIAGNAETLATLPVSSLYNGRLVYLSAADGGFAADTLVRYAGGSWKPIGPFEVLSSVPVAGNFAGRLVLLSPAAGGFAQWSLIRYDGAAYAQVSNGVDRSATIPGSGNFAGRMVLLTAAAGGFDAYSLIVYNGSTWARAEKRGVDIGTSLPGSPYAGQIFVPTTAVGGLQAYDVVRYNGSIWQQISAPPLISVATFNTLVGGSPPDGYEVHLQADSSSGVNWHLRYNAGSASVYKWEYVGGSELANEVSSLDTTVSAKYVALTGAGPSIALPRPGDYDITIGAYMIMGRSGGGPGLPAYMSYDIGGTGAVDADAIIVASQLNEEIASTVMRTQRKVSLTAVTLTAKYGLSSLGSNAGSWSNRFMRVRPVRIS